MLSKTAKSGDVSGKSPAKDVITPVQVQKESLMAQSDKKLIKRQLVKTLSKMDVTMCICGRNRESAARDRKDWVQCETCSGWTLASFVLYNCTGSRCLGRCPFPLFLLCYKEADGCSKV